MEARTENRVSQIEYACQWIAEIGHDAEPLGTVRLIFLDRASREKTLAPTDVFVREKTGCISPMAIRHHVGMASTSRQTVIKSNDNMHRNEGWEGRDTGETQN